MDLREIAELALVGGRSARRKNATFRLNHNRLMLTGFSPEQIERVEQTVRDIEQFTETALSSLLKGAPHEATIANRYHRLRRRR